MSIQMIAKELYGLQQAVEKIERQLGNAWVEKESDLKDQLRKMIFLFKEVACLTRKYTI